MLDSARVVVHVYMLRLNAPLGKHHVNLDLFDSILPSMRLCIHQPCSLLLFRSRASVLPSRVGSLNLQGRQLVCESLVQEGKAIWLAPEKERKQCLITRQPVRVWASTILRIVTEQFTTKTMPVENLYSGEDVVGTGALPALRAPHECPQ